MAIYIPNKIRVGYQNREDTFTKKLAYVIYYDNFGKLRKEKSWESWRDKKIKPKEFENVPTSGFVLNKGHTRYNWSHFGNSKTVRIRIYDPRGIEFEITAENLVACLMHTDCSRREITGEMVYAWNGTELMLLPCTSDEYEKAKKHTELQAKKFSAKDLKEGATYLTKSEEKVTYLGRFMFYQWKYEKGDWQNKRRVGKKEHIFVVDDDSKYSYSDHAKYKDKRFKPLSPSGVLAVCVDENPCENYATLVDWYLKKCPQSSKAVGLSIRPTEPVIYNPECRDAYERNSTENDYRWSIQDGIAHKWHANTYTYELDRTQPTHWGTRKRVALAPAERVYCSDRSLGLDVSRSYYSNAEQKRHGAPSDSGDLVIKYENGLKEIET